MKEFWSVLGRVATRPDLHSDLLTLALRGTTYEKLGDFCAYLWRLGYGLGRWEIMTLQLVLTETHEDPTGPTRKILRVEDDEIIQKLQRIWNVDLQLPAPEDDEFSLLAVIGLTLIDTAYRKALFAACDPSGTDLTRLKGVVSDDPTRGPIFTVRDEQMISLNRFLVAERAQTTSDLEVFHTFKWVQPARNSCPVGFTFRSLTSPSDTFEGTYAHVSWPRLLALSLKGGPEKDLLGRLKDAGVVIEGEPGDGEG